MHQLTEHLYNTDRMFKEIIVRVKKERRIGRTSGNSSYRELGKQADTSSS